MPNTNDIALEILKIMYAVQFEGFLRGHTPEEWQQRWTTGDVARYRKLPDGRTAPIPSLDDNASSFEEVPDFLLWATISTRGVQSVPFRNALRLLEERGDIRFTRDENWYGRWCTADGHVIEVWWAGDSPSLPDKPPYNTNVKLDGRIFERLRLYDYPTAKCFKLTAEGIRRREAAGGAEPHPAASGDAQPAACGARTPANGGEGDAAAHSPPWSDPAAAVPKGDLATKTQAQVSIPNRARKAGEQYRQAAEALGVSSPTDREAYEQLVTAFETSGEKAELPRFDTWQRNLRKYRQLTRQQKNKPRTGRERNAGSLVRADQIEPEYLPTRVRHEHVDQ